jgi:hypothetical protein
MTKAPTRHHAPPRSTRRPAKRHQKQTPAGPFDREVSLTLTLAQYYAAYALAGAIAGGMSDPELLAEWAIAVGDLMGHKYAERAA